MAPMLYARDVLYMYINICCGKLWQYMLDLYILYDIYKLTVTLVPDEWWWCCSEMDLIRSLINCWIEKSANWISFGMEHIATPKVENVHLLDNINTRNSRVSNQVNDPTVVDIEQIKELAFSCRWGAFTSQPPTWFLSLLRRRRSSGSFTCTSAQLRSSHWPQVAVPSGSSVATSGRPRSWWRGTGTLRTSSPPWSTSPGPWRCPTSTASSTGAKATCPSTLAGRFSTWGPSFRGKVFRTGSGRFAAWTTTTRSAQPTPACLWYPPPPRRPWWKAQQGFDQKAVSQLSHITTELLELLYWGAANLFRDWKVDSTA